MADIICPHCGRIVKVNASGRKRIEIPVKNIYDAIRISKNEDGTANYSAAAVALEKMTGIHVSKGFVHARLGLMAGEKGITRVELAKSVLNE